jgi:putative addiction module CopG family antidote
MTEVLVRLPEESQSFVEERIATGEFASASDYLLSLIESARKQAAVERVDQRLLEGLASGPGENATPEWWARTRAEWQQGREGAAQP